MSKGARVCQVPAEEYRESASERQDPARNRRRCLSTIALLALPVGVVHVHPVAAETFSSSFLRTFEDVCAGGGLGSDLSAACSATGSAVASTSSGLSAQGHEILAIEERLQASREAEEEKPEGGANRGMYALNRSRGQSSDLVELQLPPAGGGPSAGIVTGRTGSYGLFLSAGASYLDHHNNRFEDGYEANLPTVTVGGDVRINDWLVTGLAFNYTRFDGTYDDGGGFDKDTFGPILYASMSLFEGAFADIVLAYARQEVSNKRRVRGTTSDFSGRVSADYDTNQYSASLLTGYDRTWHNVTFGPRLGLGFTHWQTDSFEEDSSTGLELRYKGLNRTSVQSSAGARAAMVFDTRYGAIVPQAGAAWVHEFADSARNIEAEFVDVSPEDSPSFTFNREPPARDWAVLGAGVSAFLPNGLQPFVTVSTVQGNDNFVSYGGIAGMRASF